MMRSDIVRHISLYLILPGIMGIHLQCKPEAKPMPVPPSKGEPASNVQTQKMPQNLLLEPLKLGSGYEQVAQKFPEITPLQPVAGNPRMAELGFLEASMPFKLEELEGVLTSVFKQQRLNAYFFEIKELDQDRAKKLFTDLQDFYEEHYGPCRMDALERPNVHLESCAFELKEADFAIMLNLTMPQAQIRWGYQSVPEELRH